jgi:hypothetical protein
VETRRTSVQHPIRRPNACLSDEMSLTQNF